MSENREQQQEEQQEQQQEQQEEQQEQEQQEEQGEEKQEQGASEEKRSDWRDREIARLRGRVRDLRGENENLKRAPAQTTTTETVKTYDDRRQEFDRLVNDEVARRAPIIAQIQEFNKACDEAAAKGRKDYPDFNTKLQGLLNVVDMNDQSQSTAYNNFLAAALETGDAPRLIYELGSDPNKASALLAMTPVRMAVELTKMASSTQEERREETRAGRPITPINRTSNNRNPIAPDDPDRADSLSTAEWMRRRTQQLAERNPGRRTQTR